LQADADKRYSSAGELARQLDLCRKPRARELLYPQLGWRTWVRRHPLLAIYPMALLPNMVASWLSIQYNDAAIVAKYPEVAGTFRLLQTVVNGAFFPIGVILFGILIWPVARGLRGASLEELPRLRRRCLQLGPGSVLVCLWAWVLAGVIFPVTLHFAGQGLSVNSHLHFFASQTLCGLIAVTYPQFCISFLAVRALYPALLPTAALSTEDSARLRWLDRSLGWFLILAASVPMLAIGLLAIIGSENRPAMGALSAVGLAGFGLAYQLTTAIRADIAALLDL